MNIQGPRAKLPNRRDRESLNFDHGGFTFTAGIGRFPDNSIAEIFLAANVKSGTAIEAWARDSATLASIDFPFGADVETIRHALTREANGRASSPLGEVLDIIAGPGEAA